MKINLKDITFLMLVRLDSVQRLENIIAVTDHMCKYFETNIVVREASNYNNGILKRMLHRSITYEFVDDKDPVLYKTKHFNDMAKQIITPLIAIWDADVIVDKDAVMEGVGRLRKNECDVVYPYNGICLNVPEILRKLYLKKRDIRCLYRHIDKMKQLHVNKLLVGGAVMMQARKYIQAGMENEKHYGWSNDDFDRYYRFLGLEYNIYQINVPLFHLTHPRYSNSGFHSYLGRKISFREMTAFEYSSKEEIIEQLTLVNALE
jgi:hypothetical protein